MQIDLKTEIVTIEQHILKSSGVGESESQRVRQENLRIGESESRRVQDPAQERT